MTSKKNRATTKAFNAVCLGISFFMAAAPAVLADTFSIDGTALNTNNQFLKLDGTPLVSSWPLDPNDSDQQFEIISRSNSNNKILKHKSTSNNSVSYCLNAHYLSNGGKVNLWPCNLNDSDQNFVINNSINNTYSIQRAGTSFCIDLPGRGKNQQVTLWQCNNGSNQLFTKNAGVVTNNNSANTPYLPFDPGVTATITQGYNGTVSHGGSSLSTYNSYAVDFAPNRSNVSARAVRAGKVIVSGEVNDGYGKRVIVQYNDNTYGIYAHLNQIYVPTNSSVVGGQGLGLIGSTGNSTGIHLHYAEGRRIENLYVMDRVPLRFIDAPNANFSNSGFTLTSSNSDNRR
jgi:murein DD-endopeptidase MepM/ murein hydrolase activator NlpD